MAKEAYYTKCGLKLRGWSDRLIALLLKEPDLTCDNPHYKCAPPMRLYRRSRVHEAEKRKPFLAAMVGREQRQERARKAVETKREKLQDWIDRLDVQVPVLDWDKLTQGAIAHYNDWQEDRFDRTGNYDIKMAGEHSDKGFLDRIRVNYLRHELTDYEQTLDRMAGKVGASDGYVEVKVMMLNAIADTYPQLAAECRKQASAVSHLMETRRRSERADEVSLGGRNVEVGVGVGRATA